MGTGMISGWTWTSTCNSWEVDYKAKFRELSKGARRKQWWRGRLGGLSSMEFKGVPGPPGQ